jgi:hypothetical protein
MKGILHKRLAGYLKRMMMQVADGISLKTFFTMPV